MTWLEFERNKMIATAIFVAALFTSSAATGPSASQSYGGYGHYQPMQQQQQQYQPSQQQDRWYTEANQASNTAQPSTTTSSSVTPAEETEKPPLPEGWSEHFDPNSGQHYYYNAADGTTSWDRPQPPSVEEQGSNQSESTGEDSSPLEQNAASAGPLDVTQSPTPEQERLEAPEEVAVGGVDGKNENAAVNESSSTQPSGGQQQGSWGGQGQSQFSQDSWSSPQPSQQQPGVPSWGQSNSTESSVVRGELEGQKVGFEGQSSQNPPQPQQQEPSPGWGLPQQPKPDDPSPKPIEPWGVRKSPEPQNPYQSGPPKQMQPPAPTKETPPDNSPQSNESPLNQRQSWQDQRPPMGNQQRPPTQQGPPQRPPSQQQPPTQQGPPQRPPSQQQPPTPQYLQRQYPPYGSYNPNAPPGQGQYDPRYGGQNPYGRGYPPPQQQTSAGQLISQATEDGTSAVKEALGNTWKGLLGFGSKTREVVGTARDQVVTGATAAGQTLSERSSSIWESAKGVFENTDPGSQSTYNLGGHTSPSPDNRSPPNYPGRPGAPSHGYPGPGGMGPPPRGYGGPQQQPGRYGPPGQQPPYGGPQSGSVQPPGRQPPPAPHQQPPQQMRQPGYPNMQPRRDPPYPQRPNGQERSPMQSQYGGQPPPQGGHPPQQRPPYPGPPGTQPRGPGGPGMTQGAPQQEKASDPWDHPALTGDY
eukprot:CAMPEP_0116133794 /NCGR_PEP_ID=MMETSP0329-20121206/10299_1 /TAXON_ID=697910 /ORGANISM="Pseudo-nitzschia arenysensis, Strain B593" /LENGTH=696 /DNA_ID=CAMNT_0003628455 /DNA_START=59 /DNA_END=2149 /DNA_ORIENTATION=-